MKMSETVASIAERLATVPRRADVALVIRHAEREEIPPATFGADVLLTASGVVSAERLGALLSVRELVDIKASPVPRCMHTAEAVIRGGDWSAEVVSDCRLGDPGPFVIEPEVSGAVFLQIGILELVRRQLTDATPPPGMRATSEGVKLLLELAVSSLEQGGRLNVYVTHDSILAALVARLFRLAVDGFAWPDYLDGLLLWRSRERLHFSWRGLHQASHPVGG